MAAKRKDSQLQVNKVLFFFLSSFFFFFWVLVFLKRIYLNHSLHVDSLTTLYFIHLLKNLRFKK